MKTILVVLALLLAGIQSSAATTFVFTINNGSQSDIDRFFVRGGEIEGPTKIPANAKREVKITLPDGKCRAGMHFDFAGEHYMDDDVTMDFCKYGGLNIN